MQYKRHLNIDDVRDDQRRIVNSMVEYMVSRLWQIDRALKLNLNPPSVFKIQQQAIQARIDWVLAMILSPLGANTVERLNRRLRLAQELMREHGIPQLDILDPDKMVVVNMLVKSRLPADERREIDDAMALLVHTRSILKAQTFVLDPELITAISEAKMGEYDHPLMFPYPNVWVESSERMPNPLDTKELLTGASMVRPYGDQAALRAETQRMDKLMSQMPYKTKEELDAQKDYMEYHTVYSRLAPGSQLLSHHEYFPTRDNKGYNGDGVINDQLVAENAACKPTKLTARLLMYLVSSNVEYELVQRTPPKGAGRRRRQRATPYYVTRVKKNYVHGLSAERNASRNSRYSFRFSVAAHWFHRWYCDQCNKVHAIRRFLAERECVRCGVKLQKMNAVVRVFWQTEYEKGPDVADQAQRRAYELPNEPLPDPEEPDTDKSER